MYHYDGHGHVLRPVREAGHPTVRRLLTVAGHSAATGCGPQVLLAVSSRAGPLLIVVGHGAATGCGPQVLLAVSSRASRLLWKYEGMGYALTRSANS
ncbi:hypothetical protein ACIBI9_11250 [Nonomuraea sp. NPDC050451]|uniref:hypothetical protein n=1 Tax=Nonomuraea sp. NPDC050451 TaxID=3364364 RepID=UPI0037A43AB6